MHEFHPFLPLWTPHPGRSVRRARLGEKGVFFQFAVNLILTAILFVGGKETCLAQKKPTKILGVKRLDNTAILNVGNGDNWHMTWAADGRQFTGLCDGKGFAGIPGETGEYRNSRVYAIIGEAPMHHFEYLPGYPELLGNTFRFYGFGILAIDDHIYQYASTPRRRFGGPPTEFVGAKLTYSPDNGKRWCNQDGTPLTWEKWEDRNRENMVFWEEPGGAFSLLSILQYGRNYEHNRDGFVYVYAPNGNTPGTMNQLVMFRVPKNKILDRSAYKFFTSRNSDGTANWSSDINQREAVYTFPSGWVNQKTGAHPYAWQPSVVYNEPLKQYMMTSWGTGLDESKKSWFPEPNYLGFWTAPNPWGPWTQIHEEKEWTVNGDKTNRNYQPQFSPKWIAPDGKSFWLVWTNFKGGYAFNCQKVIIQTENK